MVGMGALNDKKLAVKVFSAVVVQRPVLPFCGSTAFLGQYYRSPISAQTTLGKKVITFDSEVGIE